jgi:hypothetical protein
MNKLVGFLKKRRYSAPQICRGGWLIKVWFFESTFTFGAAARCGVVKLATIAKLETVSGNKKVTE